MKFTLSNALVASAVLSAPFADAAATDKRVTINSKALQKAITSEGYVNFFN